MTEKPASYDAHVGVGAEPLVSESAYNKLLREWQPRKRMIPRDIASHPITLRKVMAELDALGQSKAGDCIQSLVFELQISRNRERRFADELIDLSR